MTKTTNHKLILWLPLLFMAFYTSIQISKIHTTAQINYNAMSVGASATQITITDREQVAGENISRDTANASYTMTQINTEVLDIRADISQQVSKDGFKAVGDLAMELAADDNALKNPDNFLSKFISTSLCA